MPDKHAAKIGATYACDSCDLRIVVTSPCTCGDGGPSFKCCGMELTRYEPQEEPNAVVGKMQGPAS